MSKELIAGIVIAAVIISIWCVIYSKKAPKRMVAAGAAALAMAGLFSGLLMLLAPVPTEAVEITAMDEKNEASGSTELYLTGIWTDGRATPIPDVSAGKWYWLGDWYCWRPPGDPRIPQGGEGLTQSIRMEIPLGYHREFEFTANKNKGKVSVAFAGETQIVDCYSSSDEKIKTGIASSSMRQILLFKAVRLGAFALGMLLLGALFLWVLMLLRKKKESLKNLVEKHWDKLAYGTIAAAMLLFMMCYADKQSFWGDEMHQIAWVRPGLSLGEILHTNITLNDATPPLYALLFALWYRLAPYGDAWLLLPSEIAVAVGVFFLGILGGEIRGKRAGIFAAILGASSSVVMTAGGFELRSYALFFLTSALSLLTYTYKFKASDTFGGIKDTISSVQGKNATENTGNNSGIYKCTKQKMFHTARRMKFGKRVWAYAAAISLMAYSHIYGLILCGILFLFDAFLFLKKRHGLAFLFPYLFAALAFSPYALAVVAAKLSGQLYRESLPGEAPGIPELQKLVEYITSNNSVLFYLFLLGTAFAIAKAVVLSMQKNFDWRRDYYGIYLSGVVWGNILLVFLFVKITGNDIMNWRYFIGVTPCVIIVSAMALEDALELWQRESARKMAGSVAAAAFLVFSVGLHGGAKAVEHQQDIRHPFRQLAAYLTAQNDFYRADVAVLLCGRDPMRFGWQYYLTEGGRRDERPILSWSNQEDVALLPAYQKIYIYYPYSISAGFKNKLRGWGFKQVHENKTNHFLIYQKE